MRVRGVVSHSPRLPHDEGSNMKLVFSLDAETGLIDRLLGNYRGETTEVTSFQRDGQSDFSDTGRGEVPNAECFVIDIPGLWVCDFCDQFTSDQHWKAATSRPSDPYSYCSVMWGCDRCGDRHGLQSDDWWENWCEANGKMWEG